MDEAQVGSEEITAPHVEAQETVTNEPQVESVVESRQDRNWRELRKSHDELKNIAKSQAEMLEQLKAQLVSKEVDEFDSIGDEDYIPKGKVQRLVEKEIQKAVPREAEKLLQKREQDQFLERLKRQFSDFDDIVNPETIAILEKQDPDLAASIADIKDPYKIGLQSYKFIKALNLVDKVPQQRRRNEVEKKIEKNEKTVQTPQAYDKRPMAQAFRMTDAEKSALYKEMMEYANQSF